MKITENTKITISLLIAMLGGVGWLTKMNYMTEATAKTVDKVLERQEKYTEDISAIRQDITVIKRILEERK